MQAIVQLGDRLSQININNMIDQLFGTSKYQRMLPDMVRERLNKAGTYSTGEEIRTFKADLGENYSAYTMFVKDEKGQTTSHVTLKDTGAFHQSFNLQPKQTYAVIEYDENKPEGKVSDNIPDLPNVFGLSEGEMTVLRSEVLPDLITMIKQDLRA